MYLEIRYELFRFTLFAVLVFGLGWFCTYPLEALLIFHFCYVVWAYWKILTLVRYLKLGANDKGLIDKGVWGLLRAELNIQARRQAKLVKKMREAVKRTSELTHAIGEGVVVLNRGLKLDWWNSTAQELLSLESSDKGQPLTNLMRDSQFSAYLKQDKFDGDIELPARTRPEQSLLFKASHFGKNDIVLVVSDITKLKNMERIRKEFVGNVSHELRTPITVLRGYLEALSDGVITDSSKIKKACLQMSEQVVRMQNLADDLIVLSRLEEQKKELPMQKVYLAQLYAEIMQEAEIVSEGRHILIQECAPDIFIMAQQSDIHSMISNLMINAIRHNLKGATIHLKAFQSDDALSIVVSDDGVGISAEAIPRLTERFYRTDESRSSKISGTGLGLAIVKHIVHRYQGCLEIKSKLGEGAEFILIFPCEPLQERSV